MTNITIDLSNYRDRVGGRIEPGRYRVVVEDAWEDKSNAGNTMITMNLRVSDGGEFDGTSVIDRLVLSEKSLFRVVGFMQAIGLPTPKRKLQVNLSRFIGQTLEIDVEDGDPYNGRVKSEVRAYYKVPKAQQSESADLEDLDALDVTLAGDAPEVEVAAANGSSAAPSLAERVAAARVPNEAPAEESFDDGTLDLDAIDI